MSIDNLNDIPDDTKITVVLGIGNDKLHSMTVNACDNIA